jgi:hypothetical protein
MLPALKGDAINPSKRPLYQVLATLSEAIDNCRDSGNTEWATKHGAEMDRLCREYLPSGSGFDSGTKVASYGGPVLTLTADYHHMDAHGSYSGWTYHRVVVLPNLAHGFYLNVTGRDKNGIKDYIAETFDAALRSEMEQTAEGWIRAEGNVYPAVPGVTS